MFGIDSCLSWHKKCSQGFSCPFAQCADKLFFLLFLTSLVVLLSLQDQFLCRCNKIYLNLQLHWPGFVYSNYSIRVSEWCIISGSSHTATWHCSWEVQAHRQHWHMCQMRLINHRAISGLSIGLQKASLAAAVWRWAFRWQKALNALLVVVKSWQQYAAVSLKFLDKTTNITILIFTIIADILIQGHVQTAFTVVAQIWHWHMQKHITIALFYCFL